jgi:hypothetical protein
VPVPVNATALPEFSFVINNASTPLFFFSKQTAYACPFSRKPLKATDLIESRIVSECSKGMVFSVNANPDSAKSFAAFQANAEATAPASTTTAAPVAASSGAAIFVLVGANNQLTFSPSNITANVGDTVTFQFESKNHVRAICHPLSLH